MPRTKAACERRPGRFQVLTGPDLVGPDIAEVPPTRDAILADLENGWNADRLERGGSMQARRLTSGAAQFY
jgi:hypothetical protein